MVMKWGWFTLVYIGWILRYIGLLHRFDMVWCQICYHFGCRKLITSSLGLGRMTISWPAWTRVPWSWPSTTGRSLGKRGPSESSREQVRMVLNGGIPVKHVKHCETHAEIEMLLKFKTIDFFDLSCDNHFSLSEDSRSPAMEKKRLTPMISLCTVAISSQWFLKSDATQCYIHLYTYQLRHRNKRQCVLWLWLLAIPLASTAAGLWLWSVASLGISGWFSVFFLANN